MTEFVDLGRNRDEILLNFGLETLHNTLREEGFVEDTAFRTEWA